MTALWLRSVQISESGAHHDEIPLTSVSSGERVDRVILDWHVNIVTGSSAVIQTWLDRGILVAIQWVEGEFPVDPPGDIGEANLDSLDIMASDFVRVEANSVFVNWYSAPAAKASVRLDTPVHRKPDGDNVGFVYLTWGLADFAGAGVEVGFGKSFARVLIDTPFA